jgi:hypothetical protein
MTNGHFMASVKNSYRAKASGVGIIPVSILEKCFRGGMHLCKKSKSLYCVSNENIYYFLQSPKEYPYNTFPVEAFGMLSRKAPEKFSMEVSKKFIDQYNPYLLSYSKETRTVPMVLFKDNEITISLGDDDSRDCSFSGMNIVGTSHGADFAVDAHYFYNILRVLTSNSRPKDGVYRISIGYQASKMPVIFTYMNRRSLLMPRIEERG